MFWRLEPADYEANFRRRSLEGVTGGPNRSLMADIVAGGEPPGLMAYRDGRPAGWVSVSPASDLVRLARSPQLHFDDYPGTDGTWSISCFYVYRSDQRAGVGTALLEAAVARATEHGATAVEAYPVRAPSVDPYTGYDTMFEAAGFRLLKPGRGRGRALWRRELKRR